MKCVKAVKCYRAYNTSATNGEKSGEYMESKLIFWYIQLFDSDIIHRARPMEHFLNALPLAHVSIFVKSPQKVFVEWRQNLEGDWKNLPSPRFKWTNQICNC